MPRSAGSHEQHQRPSIPDKTRGGALDRRLQSSATMSSTPRHGRTAVSLAAAVLAVIPALVGACGDDGGVGSQEKGINCNVQYDGCSCNPTTGSPGNDYVCDEDAVENGTCCASSGWPNSGTCSCKPRGGCTGNSSYCSCSKSSSTSMQECPSTTGVCCKTSTGCYCSSTADACKASETVISSCTADEVEDPCGYETQVSSCSDGGSTGSGNGSSSGSGTEECSPTSGECEDSGDCSCGQACYPTAVCETCASRCNFPCETDQDCLNLTGLTREYTTCTKTSPNYEIYACE
jgi:hypothetical protein